MQRLDLLPATLVATILLLAPWPQGSVEGLFFGPLEGLAAGLLLFLAWQPDRVLGPVSRPLRWLGVAVLGLLALGVAQVIPLGGLLPALSPNSHALTAPYLPEGAAHPGTISLYAHQTRVVVCMWAAAAAILLATARACQSAPAQRRVAGALVVAATANAAVGLACNLAGTSLPWVSQWASARLHGSYRNPNHFAGLLVLGLPLCLAFAGIGEPGRDPRSAARRRRLLWLLPAGLLLACVVLSRSRGGAVAAVTAVGVYLLLATPGRLRELPRATLLAGLGAAAFLLTLGFGPLADRLAQTLDHLGRPISRLTFFVTALDIWRDFPLFGAGLRSHEQLTPARIEVSKLVNATHNDYLNLLADGGLVAVCCLAVLLVAFGRVARGQLARASTSRRPLLAACLAGVAAHLLWALAEFNLQIQANLWAFSAAAGLACARTDRPGPPQPTAVNGRVSAAARVGLLLAALALLASAGRLAHSDWTLRQLTAPPPPVHEALASLTAAEALDPENATLPLRAGMASLSAGDVQGALPALNRACAREPRDALAHLQLARALLASGQLEPADRHLRHAATLAPYFPNRRLYAGQLWLWQHAKHGGQEALVEGLANLRAAIAWNANLLDDALSLLRKHAPRLSAAHLAQLLPSDRPDLRRRLVRDLLRRNKTLPAIRLLAPLAQSDEAAPEDLLTWAQLQLGLGSVPRALAAYLRAIPPLEPRARRQALGAACGGLIRAKRPDEAVELATRVAASAPGDARVQAELGSALFAAGRYSEASDALERALAGGHPASGVQLGRTLLRLGRTRSAIEAWQRTLPSLSEPAAYVSLALELRRLLRQEGREHDAEAALDEALRRFPADERLNKAAEAE